MGCNDMHAENIGKLLLDYQYGAVLPDQSVAQSKSPSYEDLGYVKIDHQRAARQGFPEVVFCQGKTIPQVAEIIKKLADNFPNVLGTRANREMFAAVQEKVPEARYYEIARLITVERKIQEPDPDRYIAILSAGTSDMPVAEEAAITAEIMGNKVERIYDVGVAGIHRLFDHYETICQANVCIVVAGMEGALASVVGGLVSKPLIAVPTSVGYGASFQGLAALLAMMNSCAAGVGVVNVDNGFGAGRLASTINAMR